MCSTVEYLVEVQVDLRLITAAPSVLVVQMLVILYLHDEAVI
jgi:hypothetical protein